MSVDGDASESVDETHDDAAYPTASTHNLTSFRRHVLQTGREDWSSLGGAPCERMRLYLTYVAVSEKNNLLSDASLQDILKADQIVTKHRLYSR